MGDFEDTGVPDFLGADLVGIAAMFCLAIGLGCEVAGTSTSSGSLRSSRLSPCVAFAGFDDPGSEVRLRVAEDSRAGLYGRCSYESGGEYGFCSYAPGESLPSRLS